MTMQRPSVLRLLAAVLLGVVAALGLAPTGWWWLTLAGLAALPAVLAPIRRPRGQGLVGWGFGLGYFAHGLFWIIEPFQVDVARHGWMAPFALLFLSGGLALFWGAAFWGAARLARRADFRPFALVTCWTLAEYARSYLFTGFPWAQFSQIWIDTPAALALAWIGPLGLSFLTLAAGLSLGVFLLRFVTRHMRLGGAWPWLLPPVGCAALAGAAAALALPLLPVEPAGGRVVRLVQPNAPQQEKWDPERNAVFFERQLAYTAAAPRPDLIVWPESAIPWLLEDADFALAAIAGAAGGVPVVLGAQRDGEGRYYNTLVYLDAEGAVAGLYDKHHLVPFGEYIPFGDLAARFGLHGFAAQEGAGYSAGPGPQVLGFGGIGAGLPLICYEAVFAHDVNAAPERPDFLIQITNDAWFGKRSGPYQHLVQARMRAMEQGLPLIRAANTGVSAMIDPRGRVTASIALGQAGFVDAELPRPLPPTPYSRTGDLPLFLLLLLGLGAIRAGQRARSGAARRGKRD
ncbi:apolipoprotein N-acyltransferase [Pontibaca methylaminivorans]|uniref:Apolipoprotein N-acyltransferase n=1 Tax=Pontibaca methylaminivorans TaxID=515897 RepID=A0A1R3X1F0_9RHOB|nr:apolipoprotein N-acyltransferase [Pontibaca methylaminivorans]SIT84002.1 Apolipoprotein N-acyltransferase [Pontibaca methylaminivorans]